MKIGLVCPYNIYKSGGVQECVLALREEFIKSGHQAFIITPKPKGSNLPEIEGVILVGDARDIKSPFSTTAQVSASFDNTSIDELLNSYNFDILHFHEPWVPIVSRQILARSKTINVATFHAKLPENMMSRSLEKVITPYTKSILKYIDVFTAVSDAATDYIKSLTKHSIQIVPNGINHSKFVLKKDIKRDKHTIVYIGRLEKRKGVIYLLKAFEQLKHTLPDTKLIIAGDGPDRSKLEDYVEFNNLEDVEFKGYVDEATKIKLLHRATIFCSPAIYGESFGIVLLEAMASDAVIVAGDNPGYSSVLQETGILSLINVKDTSEFARKLRMLITNQELRKLWSNWAKDYVAQFSYSNVAKKYLAVYEQAKKAHK